MSEQPPDSYASQDTGMHPLLAKQPRYCLMCGECLPIPSSRSTPPQCPECSRPFDPQNPETFSALPPIQPAQWWENPVIPGAAFLLLYLVGSAITGRLIGWWTYGIGGGDGSTGSAFAGVTMSVLLILLGLLPWMFACVYLLLLALEEHLRDEVLWYLTAGGMLGMMCSAGYHPVLLIVGLILGIFTGLVRQWRMT